MKTIPKPPVKKVTESNKSYCSTVAAVLQAPEGLLSFDCWKLSIDNGIVAYGYDYDHSNRLTKNKQDTISMRGVCALGFEEKRIVTCRKNIGSNGAYYEFIRVST